MSKKLFMAFLMILLFTAAAGAHDVGGSVQNTSILQADLQGGTDYTLSSLISQNNKVDFWFNLNFSDAFRMTGRLGWVFRWENAEADYYYDFESFNALELLKTLETLRVYGDTATGGDGLLAISYRAGRYPFSDPSGLVLNSTLDGADVTLRYADFFLRFGAWYNGFIDKKLSTILLTEADKNSFLDPVKVFAAPRLVQCAELELHNRGLQTLTFFTVFQEDIYSCERLRILDAGHYYSGHLGVVLNGVVVPNLYYGFTGIFNGGIYRFPSEDTTVFQTAQLFAVNAAYSFGGDIKPVLRAEALYTSGDDWDRSDWEGSSFTEGTSVTTMFTPVSAKTPGYIYQPKLGNLGMFRAEYSVKPSRRLQLLLSNTAFFRTVDGPLSLDTAAGASGSYLGDEVVLRANIRPLSDVGFSAVVGMFYPNEVLVTSNGTEFRADIYVSVDY